MRCKLISYNIWHGKYLEEVVAFLQEQEPDIVCLQEVATNGRNFAPEAVNVFEQVQKSLQMEGSFSEMMRFDLPEGEFNVGIATLTRLPIKKTSSGFYVDQHRVFDAIKPNRYKWPRTFLRTDVVCGTTILPIINTHFTVTPKATVTDYQLEAANNFRAVIDPLDQLIVCGDLNTPYSSQTYEILTHNLQDISLPTKPTLHPAIHRVGTKGYHVDYVLFRGASIKHLTTAIPLVDGSDHLPVVVEFEVEQ